MQTNSEFSAHTESRTHSVSEALAMTADLAHTSSTPVVRTIQLKSSSARPPRRASSTPAAEDASAQFTQPKTVSKETDAVRRITFEDRSTVGISALY
jgi:hypothetical protein